jgi:putative pyruvate formate lyase activating enzyme
MTFPAYLELSEKDGFGGKMTAAKKLMESCRLCPRACGINRLKGDLGFCKTGPEAHVSSFGPHFGEESPLVGRMGSGTIFFSSCNLGCLFCQNDSISHGREGRTVSLEELASMMLSLQKRGCHNLNLVTPTHQLPAILSALELAVRRGFNLPLVWNCGGYESLEALALLNGVVDIYMPDFKFWNEDASARYCRASGYPDAARAGIAEMYRQVGNLSMDPDRIAARGLLIRHLVMPGNTAGTGEIMNWIAQEISPDTYVNVMSQYHPSFRAHEFPELGRGITGKEYHQAVSQARRAGLRRLDQDLSPERMRRFHG